MKWLLNVHEDERSESDMAEMEPEEQLETAIQTEAISAVVMESNRAMDPLTLQGASRVKLDCADGKKRKFVIPGPNGAFLIKGDSGCLTFAGSSFISFEKDSGEFISPLFRTVPENRKA